MTHQPLNNEIPTYRVSFWELSFIVMGALSLISASVVGIGIKALNNAFNPARAEAIAKSIFDYQIPGGSKGSFGVNIGSVKLARVQSAKNPPDIFLLVGKLPLNKETDREELNKGDEPPPDTSDEEFNVTASRIENKVFCGKTVPVTIKEGKQSLSNLPSPLPAIRYIVSLTETDAERVVILTTNGTNAQEKAVAVFNSLRCHHSK
ncbi:MAG: hypothetical protein ACM37W_06470 [Actinomycetota bacterium]